MTSGTMWGGVAAVVITSTAGDVLQSSAMKQIGDVGRIRQSHGLREVLRRVLTNRRFLLAVIFMALGFFSLIITLSWGDVSVVGPAAASLAFIADTWAANCFSRSGSTAEGGLRPYSLREAWLCWRTDGTYCGSTHQTDEKQKLSEDGRVWTFCDAFDGRMRLHTS